VRLYPHVTPAFSGPIVPDMNVEDRWVWRGQCHDELDPNNLTCVRTRTSASGSWRITVYAIARPIELLCYISPCLGYLCRYSDGFSYVRPRFDSGNGQVFLFYTALRPFLGPTQTLIQWAPRVSFSGVKLQGCEADYSPSSNDAVKTGRTVGLLPIRLHYVMLN
jgi:hypothetical protein